jgi:hypothetical protein
VVFVAGALPLHPHISFLDFVHCERYAFKKPKVFGVPFFQKGDKKSLTTQDTKDPPKSGAMPGIYCSQIATHATKRTSLGAGSLQINGVNPSGLKSKT